VARAVSRGGHADQLVDGGAVDGLLVEQEVDELCQRVAMVA